VVAYDTFAEPENTTTSLSRKIRQIRKATTIGVVMCGREGIFAAADDEFKID
jgi:hypothetical protein